MTGFLEAAPAASDAEGREKLADRTGAGRAADLAFAAQPDQDFELGPAGITAEFVERHGKGIVKENGRRGKDSSDAAGDSCA
jgi:hypothetical protein